MSKRNVSRLFFTSLMVSLCFLSVSYGWQGTGGGPPLGTCFYPTESTCLVYRPDQSCSTGTCAWVDIGGSLLFGYWTCPEGTPEASWTNRSIDSAVEQGAIPGVPGWDSESPETQDCYESYYCGCPEADPFGPLEGGEGGSCGETGGDLDIQEGTEDTPSGDPCPANPT